ncbi:MAG: hypothetical protein NZ920_01955 [Aigarchaeota archaeon]|nr:hypothetical protein [Aigarchaeota archaeon]MDW8093207.1 hypothetical protein [Nitrososphaerota archaeon]
MSSRAVVELRFDYGFWVEKAKELGIPLRRRSLVSGFWASRMFFPEASSSRGLLGCTSMTI